MKSAILGSAPSSAIDVSCHVKTIKYTRVWISDHYFASDCENPKPDFLQVPETPAENENLSSWVEPLKIRIRVVWSCKIRRCLLLTNAHHRPTARLNQRHALNLGMENNSHNEWQVYSSTGSYFLFLSHIKNFTLNCGVLAILMYWGVVQIIIGLYQHMVS